MSWCRAAWSGSTAARPWCIPTTSRRCDGADSLPLVEPVYPLTAGLSGKVLRRAIGQALGAAARPARLARRDCVRRSRAFPPFAAALQRLHDPADPIDVSPEGAAWRRLAYDEFLAGQLSLALMRANVRRLSGRPLTGDGRIEDAIRKPCPIR